uniref:flagellar M-ring protein FliF C-terminal domain-containing protein n=1 Tax=Immundisolibacter sp. TaxID=1934948 RepID=UPI0035687D86
GDTDADGAGVESPVTPRERSRRSVRNFEIDRTISHSKLSGGGVKRLTVAVVVDDRRVVGPDGRESVEPRSQEELDRYTALVRDAVGFNAERGDSINVVNAAFAPAQPMPEPQPAPVWEQSWLWHAARLLLGAGALAAVVLGVLRPMLRSVRQAGAQVIASTAAPATGRLSAPAEQPAEPARLPAPQAAELPELSEQDPRRVMQVMRNWMSADA